MGAELSITRGQGFHLICNNGFTLSVQIGGGNYCANYDEPIGRQMDPKYRLPSSGTAEIAVFSQSGGMMKFPSGDTVQGWVPIEGVFSFAALLMAAEPDSVPDLVRVTFSEAGAA